MNSKSMVLAVGIAMSWTSGVAAFDLETTPLHFADESRLNEQVHELRRIHGEHKVRGLMTNMGMYASDYIYESTRGHYDTSLPRQELVMGLEALYDQAIVSLDGVTYMELEGKVANSVARFESERNARAAQQLPALIDLKQKLIRIADIGLALQVSEVTIERREDTFGYEEVFLSFKLTNGSAFDLSRISLANDLGPGDPLHLFFRDPVFSAGASIHVEYHVSPAHPLSLAVLSRNVDTLALTPVRAMTTAGEVMDFTENWTREQQDTLDQLRIWAMQSQR